MGDGLIVVNGPMNHLVVFDVPQAANAVFEVSERHIQTLLLSQPNLNNPVSGTYAIQHFCAVLEVKV